MNVEVVTIVEGQVKEAQWQKLVESYENLLMDKPEGILQSFIIQERSEPTLWRLITFWESMEKLKAMQESYPTPPGIKIFKDRGVNPEVAVFHVRRSFGM